MVNKVLYNSTANRIIRNVLKPFSSFLPEQLKFPVNGTISVKGQNIKSFKMAANPTSAVAKYLFWGDVEGFEYNSSRICCHLAKSSNLFLDIGANIGYYSLLAASVNKKIDIVAFEPMPSAYDCLVQNIHLNDFMNINPVKLALSDREGAATFYAVTNRKFKEFPQLTGDGSLNQVHSESEKVSFEVKTITLDAYVTKFLGSKKIDLIKLDTEANEDKVLRGSAIVLRQHRPIIQCEILKGKIEQALEEILKPYNYLYYRATDRGLVPVKSFIENTTKFVDYYLVPEEKKSLVASFVLENTRELQSSL